MVTPAIGSFNSPLKSPRLSRWPAFLGPPASVAGGDRYLFNGLLDDERESCTPRFVHD